MEDRQEQLKASKKTLGMAVYSMQEGQNLGQVKNLIIDDKGKRLLALVVEKRRLTKEEKLLPFSAVKSVGDDVITVERGQALTQRGLDPAVMRALRRPVQPLGARCFTTGGKTAGRVEEFYIDVADGSIALLELSGGSLLTGKTLVEGRYIIALAPHTIMLDDEALVTSRPQENGLLSSMELARDKAATTARNTVSLLGNSLNRIRGNAAEAPAEEFMPEQEGAAQAPLNMAEQAAETTVSALEDAVLGEGLGVAAEAMVEQTARVTEEPVRGEEACMAEAAAERTARVAEEPALLAPPLPAAKVESALIVEVLTPEEAGLAADGRSVNTELQEMLLVKAAEDAQTVAGDERM